MARLSKERLIAIAERLMSDELMTPAEVDWLIDDFEASTYPQATELIFYWRHKFKNASEIVEYALGETKLPKLTRDELVEVTRKLMTVDIADEFESNYLTNLFAENIGHPSGTYPPGSGRLADEVRL